MKKLLRIVLIGFVFVSVILGIPVAASPSSTNTVLLFQHGDTAYGPTILGLMFEDGTSIAVDLQKNSYQRIDTGKTGRCFAFSLDSQVRSEVFELRDGMALHISEQEDWLNLQAFREHPMKGIPIIVSQVIIGGEVDRAKVISDGASREFKFTDEFVRGNIAKVPVAKTTNIFFMDQSQWFTVSDAFEKPVPVTVVEPYSNVMCNYDYTAFEIFAPVPQKTGITLSEGQVKKIMAIKDYYRHP